jgi:predicted small secreted protein
MTLWKNDLLANQIGNPVGRVLPHGENPLSVTRSCPVEIPSLTTMKTSRKNLTFLILITVLFAVIGTSCRTVRGFGSDVKHTGDHIENAASR